MLRETRLDTNQALLVDIVEQNLRDIISTFPKRMNTFGFTPKEMEVIFLVREGTTTKQIAQLLHVSMDAVSRHRYHIRKKLGVNKKRSNLRSHLMSLE
jgi:DNA-binding CsgD family transcriptional regulator